MNALLEQRTTPDDLLRMKDGVNYELVDGELVERNMGWESSRIGQRLGGLLFRFNDAKPVVELAGSDASYRCFPDDRIRSAGRTYRRFAWSACCRWKSVKGIAASLPIWPWRWSRRTITTMTSK